MLFRVLGPLEVETDTGAVSLAGQRSRALLTALLVEPNAVVPVHRLVELLWGEEQPDSPANALQQVVARLRARLGPLGAAIVTRPPGYALVVDETAVDAHLFEAAYRAARATWSSDPPRAGALLDDALRWWRGPAFGEFADGLAGAAAARLEELRLAALEDRSALFLQRGAVTEALTTAREVMSREPLRERPVELVMRALQADGRAGEALEVFRRYRETLADELGLDPGPELRDLEVRILQDDLDAPRTQRPPAVPDARTAPATPSNLPVPPTSFVGRAAEVAEAVRLLATTRLLTVTGPGGTGKTRLALEVVATAADGEDAAFVDLAPVTEPALVVPTIAATLGVREEGWERPVHLALEAELRRRRLLLLLDNFEQVLDAATVVARLLAEAPGLTVVVTSRAPLRIRGEQVLPLAPLRLTDPGAAGALEDLARVEAVALFAERAAAAAPTFALTEENARDVAGLVARLDGLPLAIELAASRSAVLSPGAMLQRVERREPLLTGPRDLPARQQTLHATIHWSYDLLPDTERVLFRRLSVLAGGFTPESAATVCADDAGSVRADVVPGLGLLADHSLAVPLTTDGADARFGMLPTIREFGRDRLDIEDDPAPVERRHAQWFLRLAEDAGAGFRGPALFPSIVALETEHENLRAALRWSIEHDRADVGLRIVGALWRFWHLGGHLSEGRRWTAAVLDLPSSLGRTVPRARALSAAGGLAYWQGDVPAVRAAYEEALAISRELGDDPGLAEGTYNLAFADGLVPTRARSRELFEQSRRMFEQLGNAVGVADTQWALAMMAGLGGDYATARNLAEESVRAHRELGDAFGLVDALGELGRATRELEEYDTARSCLQEALEGLAPVRYRTAIAITLRNLAAVEDRLGHHLRAVRLAGAADGLEEAAGGRVPPEFADVPDVRVSARAAYGDGRVAAAWADGRAMGVDEVVRYARLDPDDERVRPRAP
ncbi:MAG TPA: BTAD domain-containing putative transcriptional regulator [Actinomycetospora sp.]|nr:BTAD domain-containing putative transcriptional regulator [Actinomycetospora sp.]